MIESSNIGIAIKWVFEDFLETNMKPHEVHDVPHENYNHNHHRIKSNFHVFRESKMEKGKAWNQDYVPANLISFHKPDI